MLLTNPANRSSSIGPLLSVPAENGRCGAAVPKPSKRSPAEGAAADTRLVGRGGGPAGAALKAAKGSSSTAVAAADAPADSAGMLNTGSAGNPPL